MTYYEGVEDDMPIWQNHEKRITSIEIDMGGLSRQMEGVESTMKDVEKTIQRGNDEQKKQLDMFYAQMADEFFTKKQATHEAKLTIYAKVVGSLLGVGGIIYALIDVVGKLF